jgi:glutathione S-transferase
MVSELMAQRSLDLLGEQVPIVAKVALQRVPEDHDSILIAFARDTVSPVLTVRMLLGSEVGDNDGDACQYLLEFLGQPIDRIDDQRFEPIGIRGVEHATNGSARDLPGSRSRNLESWRAMSGLRLVIGNKNYSSWSMRPWLLMHQRGIEFDEVQIPLRQPDSLERKLAYSPAGKVPILIDGDVRIWESLVIVEYLAEKFPEKRLWPADSEACGVARSVSAEMHAGFASLRSQMPLNCRADRPAAGRGPGVQEDVDRICEIWRDCRGRYGAAGEFLFGNFTVADAMFAPVALRFQTYGVELDGDAAEYAQAILAMPAVRDWVEAAQREPWKIAKFDLAGQGSPADAPPA